MLIPNKFNGYTRDGIRTYHIKLGGSAPQPDPLIGEAARQNAQLAKESFAFYKDLYTNEILPLEKENQKINRQLVDRYMASMDKQEAFADEQKAYYKDTFQPVEKKMAEEAMGYDSDANVDRRMGIATANVNQEFSNAQQQTARSLARFGLNPNSSAFAATNEKLTRAQALGAAGAATGAAFDTQDKAIALRAGVANFGRNMPNTALSFQNSANASGAQATSTGSTNLNNSIAGGNVMGSGFSSAGNLNSSAANIAQSDYNARLQAYNAEQDALSGLIGLGVQAGVGYFAGGGIKGVGNILAGRKVFANGGSVEHEGDGPVSGPGGPRDDMVPARLSAGEFVLNEGAVKHFGLAKLKKMNEVGLKNQAARGLLRG